MNNTIAKLQDDIENIRHQMRIIKLKIEDKDKLIEEMQSDINELLSEESNLTDELNKLETNLEEYE